MKFFKKMREGEGLQATLALTAVLGCGMLLPSAVQAQGTAIEVQRSLARTDAKCDWHMISLNCRPENNTIYELYSDDHKGKYCYPDDPDSTPDPRTGYPREGEDFKTAQWAIWADVDDAGNHAGEPVDSTVLLGPDHPLKQGEGYWMCITQRPLVHIDVCKNDNDNDLRTKTEPCDDFGGEEGKLCAVIDVKKTPDNLDMIGHPLSYTVRWKDHVKVMCNDGTNWGPVPATATAAEGTPMAAQEYGVLSEYYFTYNANGYDTYNQEAGVLEPQTGYWLRTLPDFEDKCPGGVKLLIQDHEWEGTSTNSCG